MKKSPSLLSLLLLFISTAALSQTISVQGVLRDPNGRSVADGFYSVVFRIYDVPTGGVTLWEDTYTDLQTRHGVFQANLGEQTSLDGLAFDKEYYVGVTVEDYNEISPRIPLTIYPYSKAILGQENKFPSVGNVELLRDSIIIHQGALRLRGADGVIMFNDGTTLNTAEFGGPATSLINPTSISINADKDALGTGNINLQIAGQTKAQLANNGNLGIGVLEPDNTLDVNSPNFFATQITGTSPIGTALELYSTGNNWEFVASGPENGFVTNSFYIYDKTAAAKRFSILGSGEVNVDQTLRVGSHIYGDGNILLNSVGSESVLRMAGATTGAGGAEIQLLTGDEHDDVVDYWWLDVEEDDFRVGNTSATGQAFRLFENGDAWVKGTFRSTGNATIGDVDAAASAFISVAGDGVGSNRGGRLILDMAADHDDLQNSWSIGAWEDDITFHSGGDKFRFNQNASLVAGVDDSQRGELHLRGDGTGEEGGEIQLFSSGDHDGAVNYWYLDAYEDDLRIGAFGDNAPYEVLRIAQNGNVGIGTGEPNNAKLVVSGVGGGNYLFGNAWYQKEDPDIYRGDHFGNREFGDGVGGTLVNNLSIRATSGILTPILYIDSDQRVKKIDSLSSNNEDLKLLRAIEITDYRMVDSIADNKAYKKVIAQQVEEVFAQAVSTTTGFVPNVYSNSKYIKQSEQGLEIGLDIKHEFVVGDNIKLILEDGELYSKVISIESDKSFTIINDQRLKDRAFVYGKEVKDYKTVDYDAISMLNVSATQELAKQLDEQKEKIAALEKENQELKEKLKKVDALEAKLNVLLGEEKATGEKAIGKE